MSDTHKRISLCLNTCIDGIFEDLLFQQQFQMNLKPSLENQKIQTLAKIDCPLTKKKKRNRGVGWSEEDSVFLVNMFLLGCIVLQSKLMNNNYKRCTVDCISMKKPLFICVCRHCGFCMQSYSKCAACFWSVGPENSCIPEVVVVQ